MAKSKNRNRSTGRDISTIASDPFTALPLLSPMQPFTLSEFEDRRLFTPEQEFTVPSSFSGITRVVVSEPRPAGRSAGRPTLYQPNRFMFDAPDRVVMCVRRERRREVLFAKRKHGRNGGRRYRRNMFSDVSCR